ncbi:hypothetical protein ACT4Y9_10775 [Acinetobacter baumannii]|uniref:hypothetical protein n=1 Tax=Acinetobacter baumannii TaxID=470 RepID=UPI003F54909A
MDRKQFEEWFKTTLSYAILEDSNVWKVDLYAFNEPTNSYLHLGVQAAFESYQHQQAKVEELQTLYTQQGINMFKLQKRVDAVEQVIAKIRNGNYASDKEEGVAKFIAGMLEQALMGGRMKGHYYIVSASFRSEIPMPWTHTISITPVVISTNLITQKVLSEIQSSVQEQVSKGEHTDAHDIAIHGLSYLGYMTKEEFEGGDQ